MLCCAVVICRFYSKPTFLIGVIVQTDCVQLNPVDICFRCKIDWVKGKNVTVKTIKKKQKHKGRGTVRTVTKQVPNDSFFNFFNPPDGEQAICTFIILVFNFINFNSRVRSAFIKLSTM